LSSVLTLLFAPSFLFLIHYFEFQSVVVLYILCSFLFFLFLCFKKSKVEDFAIVGIYFLLLCFAYFHASLEVVKWIPVFTALTFFAIFTHSALKKGELIFRFTQKFYKKNLTEAEVLFLKKGDSFWAFALFVYIVLLISLVYYGNDVLWAFFSSLGWYIYFSIVLAIQIIYGKTYAIKLYSK